MRRLSIRSWLVLALVAVFTVPVLIGVLLNALLPIWLEPDPRVRLMYEVSRNSARLLDPRWQAATRARLAALEMDLIIRDEAGRELFRTLVTPEPDHGGSRFLPGEDRWVQSMPAGAGWATFAGRGPAPQLSRPVLKRYLSEQVPVVAGVTALLVTLAGVAWFLGRAVLQPLAAMSQTARQIAAGELTFSLPDSGVREVAEVAAAFTAMGEALRSALEHQAGLEQQRRTFIGAVAHDLRTPLFVLRGHLEGLDKGLAESPEKAARYLAICREKADALDRLISNLFAYVRVEYLGEAKESERMDLGDLIRRAVAGFGPLAAAKGVTLELEGPVEPCLLEADSHLLTRALENLLDNAVRYTPPEGVIRVSWQKSATEVRFSVQDQGPGISPRDLPHLFTPLYRGDASRNRRTGGAGLGLAVARRILQAHGGDLTAANALPTGAVFTAAIPALREDVPPLQPDVFPLQPDVFPLQPDVFPLQPDALPPHRR